MTTTATGVGGSAELVRVTEALFSETERVALAGLLAGYSGLTRDAYTLDLRQYTSWCAERGLHLFTARRADIDCFGDVGPTVGRATRARLSVAGSTATPSRKTCSDLRRYVPTRLDYARRGLDRNEVGATSRGRIEARRARVDHAAGVNGGYRRGARLTPSGWERGHRTGGAPKAAS
jgi:hypothetical protein